MTRRDLPPELLALLHAIDACEREADTLVGDLSEEQVNWQEHPGQSWSVAQCLDHLTKINPFYLAGFVPLVAAAKLKGVGPFNGLRSTAIGRWFVSSMEPPVRRKLNANARAVPFDRLPRGGLVDAFKRSHDSHRALVEMAADVDVNRVTGPNPFFPMIRMRISTVLRIIPAHDRRHVWQAANVKRALKGG